MFDRLGGLTAEYAKLEKALADPDVHADQERARALGKRYAELSPVVNVYRDWQRTAADESTARELAAEDSSFLAEAEQLEQHRAELEKQLTELLAPRDPSDGKDVILEVKAGEGGEESALFAGDLLRMYLRYAERQGWKTEILDSAMTGLGGYKDATVAVKSRGRAQGGSGVWSRLKYEGGVHRVQRVPVTESQGRIHTSAAGVLVMPEANPVRRPGRPERHPGGRVPVVGAGRREARPRTGPRGSCNCRPGSWSCQNVVVSRQNREQAMRSAPGRLLLLNRKPDADPPPRSAATRLRTVSMLGADPAPTSPRTASARSPRIGYKANNLERGLDGDLDGVISALTEADLAARTEGRAAAAPPAGAAAAGQGGAGPERAG